jgi:hypothetical protein
MLINGGPGFGVVHLSMRLRGRPIPNLLSVAVAPVAQEPSLVFRASSGEVHGRLSGRVILRFRVNVSLVHDSANFVGGQSWVDSENLVASFTPTACAW